MNGLKDRCNPLYLISHVAQPYTSDLSAPNLRWLVEESLVTTAQDSDHSASSLGSLEANSLSLGI
jgi:hypothetical protein